MQQYFDKLAAAPLGQKLGGLAAVILLIVGGYYYFYLSDMQDELASLQTKTAQLKEERKGYEERERQYNQYRNEVNDLLEQQKELMRVLPKRDDIEQFIESVQAQIELSGLSKVTSVRENAVPMDMYTKIPIKMTLTGSYHQINHFFKNVGDLKRIVNIEDLALTMAAANTAAAVPVAASAPRLLTANFVASTFQFNEKKGGAAAAGGGGINIRSGGQ